MRRVSVAVAVLSLAVVGCKAKADAETGAAASADLAAAASATGAASAQTTAEISARPRMGGTVIATGNHAVEVLLHANGAVEALVMDAKGELIAKPADAKLSLTAAAKGGAEAKVDMKWDPVKARFVGQAGAGVQLVPGTVGVNLDLDGKVSTGKLANVSLAVDATHGGQVVMVGDYSVELVNDAGFVQAFVFDASGKAHATGDLDLKLDIDGKPLALTWDPTSMSYKAKLGAQMKLDAKPVTLKLAAGSKAFLGAVASYKADLDAKAKLAANAGADAKGKVGAAVNVKAPNVSAQVNAAKKAAASVKAAVKVPSPKLSATVKKSASASTGTGAKASAKAGFSLGVK